MGSRRYIALRGCGYPRICAAVFRDRQARTAGVRNFDDEFEHSAGTEGSSAATCTDPVPKFGCKNSHT